MHQLELFENEPLKPISVWLHVWSEAQRAALIKNPHRAALERCGEPAEAGGGTVTRPSFGGGLSSSTPKECQAEGSRTEHYRGMPVQSPGSGQQESCPLHASLKRRSDPPQSPEPAN